MIIYYFFSPIGNLEQCSHAADRLTKKNVNPEIESDYERAPDENQPKQSTSKISLAFMYLFFPMFTFLITATVPTISTLTAVPFGSKFF